MPDARPGKLPLSRPPGAVKDAAMLHDAPASAIGTRAAGSTVDPAPPAARAVALGAHRLSKRYGSTPALVDVDLAIPAGSVTALVGPNGAGKSTLIRTWVGFERPTSGSVDVGGVDPGRHRPAAIRLLGYVPQAASLYRGLSVGDHLDLAATLRRGFDRDGARRRLDRLGIPLRQRAGDLSGGQQAQVGLALALATGAAVLLLDEPLASLDPLARREFLAILLEAVRSTGATAVLSSHIVTDVEQACDRLIVLGGGRVRLHDSLVAARAAHRVGLPGTVPPGADLVATYPAGDGSLRSLLRLEPGAGEAAGSDTAAVDGLEPASLEEVGLGYLAAGRGVPDREPVP
jgi:ABC-2 type transport system ATP-binding protein